MYLSETQRIALARLCRDADSIAKVDGAGAVFEENGLSYQRMHNGLKVIADGYYGSFMTRLIQGLRGHHEPQEEMVFQLVLETLPEAPVMVELGGYWAYYSMWFLKKRPGGKALVAEPIAERRRIGERNLAANGLHATIVAAAISECDGPPAIFRTGQETSMVPMRSVDSLLREHAHDMVDILHVDIQGYERLALSGAGEVLSAGRAAWIFVSTHRGLEESATMDIHAACLSILGRHGYRVVAEHTPEQSFSIDGLIVAKAPGISGPDQIAVSHCRDEDLIAAGCQL